MKMPEKITTKSRFFEEFSREISDARELWKIQVILDLANDPLNEITAAEMAELRELANEKRCEIGRLRGVGL